MASHGRPSKTVSTLESEIPKRKAFRLRIPKFLSENASTRDLPIAYSRARALVRSLLRLLDRAVTRTVRTHLQVGAILGGFVLCLNRYAVPRLSTYATLLRGVMALIRDSFTTGYVIHYPGYITCYLTHGYGNLDHA